MNYRQQGDLLLKETEPFNCEGLALIADGLIHKGENHHHKMRGEFFLTDDFRIACMEDCELYHEEHKTIIIPKGYYKKEIVLEYDHFLEESRQVQD